MLSKMLSGRLRVKGLLRSPSSAPPHKIAVKRWSDLIPPDQYGCNHNNWPKKFQFMYAVSVHWETIPLFFCTGVSIGILLFSIFWAFKNKVDVVMSVKSRDNISRTMDLRNPTVHKLLLINQRYSPWPEMQDVLDKMKSAEKRAKTRLDSCNAP